MCACVTPVYKRDMSIRGVFRRRLQTAEAIRLTSIDVSITLLRNIGSSHHTFVEVKLSLRIVLCYKLQKSTL